MPARAWLWSLAVCAIAALLEGVLAGRGVARRFAELRLPRHSPSLRVWALIGLFYYLTCFLILERLLARSLRPWPAALAFALVLAILLANAGWGWLFFRLRSARASFVALLPYGALVLALAAVLLGLDRVAFVILLPYLAYLGYVVWWAHQVWRLNDPLHAP
jgi:tryptophan-rich sensory protein